MKHERRASSVSEPGRESGCVYVRACEKERERERERERGRGRDEQRRGWLRERRGRGRGDWEVVTQKGEAGKLFASRQAQKANLRMRCAGAATPMRPVGPSLDFDQV